MFSIIEGDAFHPGFLYRQEAGVRVLVCGGRDFTDWYLLKEALDALSPHPTVIVHGSARGADALAGRWAELRNVAAESYPADWAKQGPAAGPIRNKRMLDEGKPDLVVAFLGGRGTADMIKQADDAGVAVMKVLP